MFMQFLQTQASVLAPQAPSIKSKCTADQEVFTREGSSIEQIHKRFKTFEISLNLKMTLNLDRMPTPEARISYISSRTSRPAQGYIAPKIQAKYYQDWTDVLQDLKNNFLILDLKFYTQRKLIKLRQANGFFAEFYTEFSKYAVYLDFNEKVLKCHLRYYDDTNLDLGLEKLLLEPLLGLWKILSF